jgi:DNA-binding transcriptional regulator YhcF (GntR family)
MHGNGTATERQVKGPVFGYILGAHVPGDPAEATLVLAAIATFNGWKCNGDRLVTVDCLNRDTDDRYEARNPSMTKIAVELGLGIDAVRRGIRFLAAAGIVAEAVDSCQLRDNGWFVIDPEVLADRWRHKWQRIKITPHIGSRGLRARPLLLAALVAGQVKQDGRLILGTRFLGERLGVPQRTVERALASCREASVLHTWSLPPKWQMFIAMGPSRKTRGKSVDVREDSYEGAVDSQKVDEESANARCEQAEEREMLTVSRRQQHCKQAVTTLRRGGLPVANRRSPHCEQAEDLQRCLQRYLQKYHKTPPLPLVVVMLFMKGNL